jgi:hypothetical protein
MSPRGLLDFYMGLSYFFLVFGLALVIAGAITWFR